MPRWREYFAGIVARGEVPRPYYAHDLLYAARVQRLWEGPDEIDIPLQALRIGDLGIAAIPFEVFAETGLELKDKAPFAQGVHHRAGQRCSWLSPHASPT